MFGAVVLSAVLFASLVEREWGAAGIWPARAFGVLAAGPMFVGTYSYALLAEGYLNFGILGAAAVTFAEGVVLRALVSYRGAAPASKGRALIYAVALASTVILIRGDFANLLKAGIIGAGVPAIIAAAWLGRRPGPAGARVAVRLAP